MADIITTLLLSAHRTQTSWIVYWHQFLLSFFFSSFPPLFFCQENMQVVRLHRDSSWSCWSVSVCRIVCRLRCLCHLVAEFRKGHLGRPLQSRLWLHYGRKGDTAEQKKKIKKNLFTHLRYRMYTQCFCGFHMSGVVPQWVFCVRCLAQLTSTSVCVLEQLFYLCCSASISSYCVFVVCWRGRFLK